MDDQSYRLMVIDTKGSFGGKKGQILVWDKESTERPIMHASFDDWLTTQIHSLKKIDMEDTYYLVEEITEQMELGVEEFSKLNPGYPVIPGRY